LFSVVFSTFQLFSVFSVTGLHWRIIVFQWWRVRQDLKPIVKIVTN